MLDADSFQKLLEAAWVLQLERDRRVSELPQVQSPGGLPTEQPSVFVSRASLGEVLEAAAAVDEACTATISPVLAKVGSGSYHPFQVFERSGRTVLYFPRCMQRCLRNLREARFRCRKQDLKLRWRWQKVVATNPRAMRFRSRQLKRLRPTVRRQVSPSDLIHRQRLRLVQLREKIQINRQVRVIIPAEARRTAVLYARIAVLLVIVGLLVSQILRHRAGMPSVKAAFQSLRFAVENSTPQVVEAQTRVDTGYELSAIESSHLRVTDFDSESAVEDLSRFEMQNLRRQAKYGDTAAALTLGMAYEVGSQVPQSCEQAAHWIAIAAADGNPAAEYNLALRYLNGDGIPLNQDEARKWFREAANHGNSKAASALATLDKQSSPSPEMTPGHDDVARR